jgi:S-DNA-T family DNA segregation ATPase FtsK/SpoIIIE
LIIMIIGYFLMRKNYSGRLKGGLSLRQRRSQKQIKEQANSLKRTLIFELYGLCFLAISILALVQPGAVGSAFRSTFRFFSGSWDFMIPLLMMGLSLYIILKRKWPSLLSFRWSGILLICLSILILSHISLVQTATANGQFEQSIIGLTWELYKVDIQSDFPLNDLGGGMVGAVFYTALNLLFDSSGAKIIVFFIILIGILLITGKSYTEILINIQTRIQRMFSWLKEMRAQSRDREHAQETEENHNTDIGPSTNNIDLQQINEADADVGQSPKKRRSIIESIKNNFQTDTKEIQESQIANESVHSNSGTESKQEQHKPLMIHDFTDVANSQGEFRFPDMDEKDSVQNGEQTDPLIEEAFLEEALQVELLANEEEEANYKLPSYSLLHKLTKKSTGDKKDLEGTARKLEQTLLSFGVQAKVTDVHRGPAVTRYEVYPDVGVKVSKIVNLTDDIALALAAKGIRIEAPIPGKSAIGIEVPNDDVSMVSLREVLESSKYHESDSKLSIALGRDISGEPIVAHLNKMPHLLVAGATGSGKSVCINGIIASILYKAKPNEVKLMMIDPKMVELNVYNGIPHLLAPVVTDSRKASIALKKVVSEMERRYEIFSQSGTRNIEGYNEFIKRENVNQPEARKPFLPFIVVIVDELADLMMVAPGDVEDAICRLAQMARAAGIHLIIATQRPSVDVITGVIKANIPSRIAFGVSSMADSRTILDMGGAEKLLGRGDMLFLPVGASKPQRIQGAFMSDEEVEQIVEHCIEQQKAKYNEEMIPNEVEEPEKKVEVEDELYKDAVELVTNHGSASVSMLQRRFRVGYTRAARLIDSMEENGVVGPYEGSKPREVLISKEESHIS